MADERKRPLDILDSISAFLQDRPRGVPAEEIAERFFRMDGMHRSQAEAVVAPLLEKDRRFRRGSEGFWRTALPGGGGADEDATARVYGAARRSNRSPGVYRIALLRFDGETESGRSVYLADRKGAGKAPPEQAIRLLRGARLVIWSVAGPFATVREAGAGDLVRIRNRAAPFAPAEARRSPERLALHLGTAFAAGDDLLLEARLLRDLDLLLDDAESTSELPADEGDPDIPFLREGGAEYLNALPDSPGIYRMRDDEGRILYIGKSRSLRARVESYFRSYSSLAGKKQEMVRRVREIEVMILGSEADALLEEWRHIRRRRPPYNEKIEVITGPARRAAGRNLILFLPSTDERSVTLYLLRSDGWMKRVRARRNPKRTGRLGREIAGFYRGESGDEEPGAYAILTRWFEENRERVSHLDADLARNSDDLLRLVVACLEDPEITSGSRLDHR